ncbi:probable E3 ubiquitin-protein ligase XERICO [Oryza brachyantha]|uniref:probable E3 ubiquitin-protein ligase XERICO n=1 Tax=Oryza brachyantha TaxID=4533 RepID=UPI001AD9B5EE|nr:probable E3 ubiquitin-protein ligase XERICO [Oryza brachyantha]
MGISSMPAPKDSLVAYLLYNTAVSIAILADMVRAALVFLGLPVPPAWEDGDDQLAAIAAAAAAAAAAAGGPSLADRFRSRFRPARFGRRRAGSAPDCRVCLARFEPESVVNRLPCGHLFHRACLEKWLDYDHATCPLCRHRLLPAANEAPSPSPSPATLHFARI